ncbi:bacteriohemerythrin [Pseudothauera lacus]|uniref:Bacteriohemerythrin n=1 Tax=Pseudothauera lacus TaxID=2136175 RepID=A0A2T4IGY3_9RHOO|nr:bacteriohemerythrin [Pseudothauera lacus]PTD97032.1 bacteriohemerythrin [Pseudothauera lacus]
MPIRWTSDLNTGIDVIDKQHMRIVDYINELEEASAASDRAAIGRVIDGMMDYTLSHFAFEESVQEEAGYPFCKAHKRVHELFVRRVNLYAERFGDGEDVAVELHELLKNWLLSHIRRDDADYAGAVRAHLQSHAPVDPPPAPAGGWFRRLFGRAAN